MNYAQIAAGIGGAKGGSSINLAPLRFTNIGQVPATVEFGDVAGTTPNFKIRQREDADWEIWDYTALTLQPNEYVEICGTNTSSITVFQQPTQLSSFIMTGDISASGNIMSLAYEELNAVNTLTIPADFFFVGLFYNCTSLTTAPELPATTLANSCYLYMFSGCTSLTTVTCLATDISANNCTSFWLDRVAASGTFTKAASMSSWTSGAHGIPSGWTVVDAQ